MNNEKKLAESGIISNNPIKDSFLNLSPYFVKLMLKSYKISYLN